jgi:hypothetical protein
MGEAGRYAKGLSMKWNVVWGVCVWKMRGQGPLGPEEMKQLEWSLSLRRP